MPEKAAAGGAKKRGNRLGFWFFRTAVSLFGLRGAYGLLYLVCIYYLVFDRTAFRSTMAYVERRFRDRRWAGRVLDVYRILVNQGKSLIDRFYLVSGLGGFDMELRGYDKISGLLRSSGKGLILLTAHVGNWQVTMKALEKFGRTVHLLMRQEDNAAVRDTLGVGTKESRVKVIFTDGHLGGVVESIGAIRRGELVSIMGDRSYGASSMQAEFLGGRVGFPYGAFSMAASVGCPVVVLLSAKTSSNKYIIDVTNMIEPVHVPKEKRQEALGGWVQEFADAMERYVHDYPHQWFVFHDIWEKEMPEKKCSE